jgi:hypothetical protein
MPIVECKDCDKRFYYNPSWSGSGYPQQDRCTECCQGRTPESVRSRQEWEDHHPFAPKKYDTSPYRVGERAGVAIHDGGWQEKDDISLETVVSLLDTLMAWKKDQAKRVSRSVR